MTVNMRCAFQEQSGRVAGTIWLFPLGLQGKIGEHDTTMSTALYLQCEITAVRIVLFLAVQGDRIPSQHMRALRSCQILMSPSKDPGPTTKFYRSPRKRLHLARLGCEHTDDSKESCWDNLTFMQTIENKPKKRAQGVVRIARGLVVFGSHELIIFSQNSISKGPSNPFFSWSLHFDYSYYLTNLHMGFIFYPTLHFPWHLRMICLLHSSIISRSPYLSLSEDLSLLYLSV